MKSSKKRTFPSFIKEIRELEKRMAGILKIADIEPLSRKG
jgi:hypothetical protein